MAISYEEYKKKYGNEIRQGQNNLIQQRRKNKKGTKDNPIIATESGVDKIYDNVVDKFKKIDLLDKGAFDDGYQFGDVTKTVGSSVGQAGTKLFEGVYGIGTSIGNLVSRGVAEVAEHTGHEEYANIVKDRLAGKRALAWDDPSARLLKEGKKSQDPVTKILEKADNKLDYNSALGDTSKQIVQGAGYYGGMIALQSVGVPWQVTAGTTSFENSYEEAIQNGATDGQAFKSAVFSAGGEILSEYMFGGLKLPGTGKTTDAIASKFIDKINDKGLKFLIGAGISGIGEGIEEVVSGYFDAIGKKLTYMSEEELNDIYTNDDKLNDFIVGMGTTWLSNGVNPTTYVHARQGRNLLSGRTSSEQTVIDKEIENRQKENPNANRSEIEKQVEEDLQNGDISIESIESTLASDEYSARQEIIDLRTELQELQNQDTSSLSIAENLENKRKINEIQQQLSQMNLEEVTTNLSNKMDEILANNELLQKSYYNELQKGVQFNMENRTPVDGDLANKVYESAIRTIANNTNQTHKNVDMIAKLSEATGHQYLFTNNAELKEMGRIPKGNKTNGFKDKDGTIYINVDSKEAKQVIVGHETTHLLEEINSDYKAYQKELLKYAQEKGDYQEYYDYYTNIKAYKNDDIASEITAELTGRYLFTDPTFINRLTQQPTIFNRIRQGIKKLTTYFKGTSDEKALMELQDKFEDAYRKMQKTHKESEKDTSENKEIHNKKPNTVQNSLSKDGKVAKKSGIEYNKNGNLDKYKSSTLFNNIMQKGKASTDEFVLANDGTNYYRVHKDINNEYEIISKIPIEGNEDFIKDYEKRWKNYDRNGNSINESNEKIKIRQGYSIRDSSGVEGEQTWTEFIDEVLERQQTRRFNNRQSIERNGQNSGELDNSFSNDIKYSLSVDNQGNKLSVQQEKYFKNSKARDEDGNLKVVYHTTTDRTVQFNEFNPVGTDHYRFGNQVVNYYTDSKEMSGSYANQSYEMADTKKITSMKEVKDYIKEMNEYKWGTYKTYELQKDGNNYNLVDNSVLHNMDKTKNEVYQEAINYKKTLTNEELEQFRDMFNHNSVYGTDGTYNIDSYLINNGYKFGSRQDEIAQKYLREIYSQSMQTLLIYDDVLFFDGKANVIHTFKNKEDLFRNIKSINSLKVKRQYEGYINITNPYVVDGEGRYWNSIYTKNEDYSISQHLDNLEKNILYDDFIKRKIFELKGESLKENSTPENDVNQEQAFNYFKEELPKLLKEHNSYVDNVQLNENAKYKKDTYSWLWYACNYGNLMYEKPEQLKQDIIDSVRDKSSTNDIVKRVIEMNQNGSNYDGVILQNVVDYGGEHESEAPANLYITFNSNQFKAKDNLTPTKDNDIRYSLGDNDLFDDNDISSVTTYEEQLARNNQLMSDIQQELNDIKTSLNVQTPNEKPYEYTDSNNIAPIDPVQTFMERANKKIKNPEDIAPISSDITPARKTTTTLMEALVNQNHIIDSLGHQAAVLGDRFNNAPAEVLADVGTGQTNYNGDIVGKSINEIFDWAKQSGYINEFNDYLFHKSNIERHEQGKGSQTPRTDSEEIVKEYEKQYPFFIKHAQDVYKFSQNALQNQVDAGIVDKSIQSLLNKLYTHYIPFYSVEESPYTNYRENGVLKARSTLRKAIGGAGEIMTPEQALIKQSFQTKRAVAFNKLAQQIVNQLGGKETVDIRNKDFKWEANIKDSLYVDENGDKYLVAYFDGNPLQAKISNELYDELNRTQESGLKAFEDSLPYISKPIQKISNIRRNLITSWNPAFLIRNAIKDPQDAIVNSKHTGLWLKNFPTSLVELAQNKTDESKKFLALYGNGNLSGDYNNMVYKPSRGVAKLNELIELAPRYAEFKASLQAGEDINTAIYNAREVTTNFGRGGYVSKFLNRNGMTFLNASIQGMDKLVRNLSGEYGRENQVKAIVGTLTKLALFGVLPSLLNHLSYDDDEDYEALPEYVKDGYYLFKTGDNDFIRIPKGRVLSVMGNLARRSIEYANGDENAFDEFLSNSWSQIGVDPEGSNILAPIKQAYGSENGTAWYGGDIVPTRLQDKPKAEQYDTSTDAISKFIGKVFNVSPYKLNYVIDQYSGAIGDIGLPLITPETTNDKTGLANVLAPMTDQFVVDSTTDNKYVSNIYNLADELKVIQNGTNATDEDKLRYKYIASKTSEMSKLYKERRELQEDSTMDKKLKYQKLQAIKNEINSIAKDGLDNYKNITTMSNYSKVEDKEYYLNNKGEWTSINDEELDELNALGMTDLEKNTYFETKDKTISIVNEYKEELANTTDSTVKTNLNLSKKIDITNAISNSGLSDLQKFALYDKYYASEKTISNIQNSNIDFDTYAKSTYEIESIKNQYKTVDGMSSKEKTAITNTRKRAVQNYIDSLNIDIGQKVIVQKVIGGYSVKGYENYMIPYIDNLNISQEEKQALYDALYKN